MAREGFTRQIAAATLCVISEKRGIVARDMGNYDNSVAGDTPNGHERTVFNLVGAMRAARRKRLPGAPVKSLSGGVSCRGLGEVDVKLPPRLVPRCRCEV